MNAKSALDFGAKTPAGEKRESLMINGLASPSHLIEYGGFVIIFSVFDFSVLLSRV